jgi:hypothetical protein
MTRSLKCPYIYTHKIKGTGILHRPLLHECAKCTGLCITGSLVCPSVSPHSLPTRLIDSFMCNLVSVVDARRIRGYFSSFFNPVEVMTYKQYGDFLICSLLVFISCSVVTTAYCNSINKATLPSVDGTKEEQRSMILILWSEVMETSNIYRTVTV